MTCKYKLIQVWSCLVNGEFCSIYVGYVNHCGVSAFNHVILYHVVIMSLVYGLNLVHTNMENCICLQDSWTVSGGNRLCHKVVQVRFCRACEVLVLIIGQLQQAYCLNALFQARLQWCNRLAFDIALLVIAASCRVLMPCSGWMVYVVIVLNFAGCRILFITGLSLQKCIAFVGSWLGDKVSPWACIATKVCQALQHGKLTHGLTFVCSDTEVQYVLLDPGCVQQVNIHC